MANNNPGKELLEELATIDQERRLRKLRNHPLTCAIRGAWVFASGTSLLLQSLTTIWLAHTEQHWPSAWRTALTVSGVLVLLPAGSLLYKFFKTVGEIK